MVSTRDDGFSNRGCGFAFFFFSLFDVWVSILFDLLMSMVMGFQRDVQTCDGNGFAVFSFFFFV